MSPGKLKDVINVGATDASDSRPTWSNYGTCVSMFAPGVSVGSADYYSDVALASWNGTSLAAPFVSGAVALYLQGHPSASPATVRTAILGNTTGNVVKNVSGSANKLLYTSFIGSVATLESTPTPTSPTTTSSAPAPIASVGGAGVSYKCASRVCAFDAGASAPSGGVASYTWYFGDGSSATGRAVSHTYGSATSYTWALFIVSGTGAKYSTGKSITPASASGSSTNIVPAYIPPTTTPTTSGTFAANFTVSCNAMHSCTFNAGSSVIPKGVSSYNWFFGDGYEGTTVMLTHDYSGRKTVSVTLKIYDKSLAYKSITKTVTVP
jgi:hypothetical protein